MEELTESNKRVERGDRGDRGDRVDRVDRVDKKVALVTNHKSRQISTGSGRIDKKRASRTSPPHPAAPPHENPEGFAYDVEPVIAEPGADQFTTFVPTLPTWIKPRTYEDLDSPKFVLVKTDIKSAIRELNSKTNQGVDAIRIISNKRPHEWGKHRNTESTLIGYEHGGQVKVVLAPGK